MEGGGVSDYYCKNRAGGFLSGCLRSGKHGGVVTFGSLQAAVLMISPFLQACGSPGKPVKLPPRAGKRDKSAGGA